MVLMLTVMIIRIMMIKEMVIFVIGNDIDGRVPLPTWTILQKCPFIERGRRTLSVTRLSGIIRAAIKLMQSIYIFIYVIWLECTVRNRHCRPRCQHHGPWIPSTQFNRPANHPIYQRPCHWDAFVPDGGTRINFMSAIMIMIIRKRMLIYRYTIYTGIHTHTQLYTSVVVTPPYALNCLNSLSFEWQTVA